MGVNFGLFGATVKKLGSDKQWKYWLPKIEALQEFGCFALTELGHGSNVRGIQTQAVYKKDDGIFEITTPCEEAQKYWIGGAAQNASYAVVFANLRIENVQYGIHVFIVKLRNKDGTVCPGITVADCGGKAGLNGVDNGRIWFDATRVAREDMLSGISQVAPDGTYTSDFDSADARFGVLLAALTGGRVGIAFNSISSALLGLTIAIRYSFSRTAFSPKKGLPEVPLLYYTSQQRNLMIPLASAYVYAFCARDLREDWYRAIESNHVSKSVHSLSAAFKALFTWFMQDTLQKAREACGGQGYKTENYIAPLKADRDVMLTFEGANGVMLQQVSKVLLSELELAKRNRGKFTADSVLSVLNTPPTCTGDSRTLDNAFFQAAFWKREKLVVAQLGRQFSAALEKRKGNRFHAWNDCLRIAEKAATAHMHRRIYEAHLMHVKRASAVEDECGKALSLCGRVWGVEMIHNDVDFLRLGCLSKKQMDDVDNAVDSLCYQMTGIAKQLISGIGFPEHLLSPIAGDYIAHNSRAKL